MQLVILVPGTQKAAMLLRGFSFRYTSSISQVWCHLSFLLCSGSYCSLVSLFLNFFLFIKAPQALQRVWAYTVGKNFKEIIM